MSQAAPLLALDLGPGLRAALSTRAGGVSCGGYESLNLGEHVGDQDAAVQENRARVQAALGLPVQYLHQVHGAQVVPVHAPGPAPAADAAWTDRPGVALAVLVADCLPVLLVARDARGRACAVAVAHAGWRGLAAGVLAHAVAALRGAQAQAQLQAWLGPCIGAAAFEVGEDVLRGFGREPGAAGEGFRYLPRSDGSPRWRADLHALARQQLAPLAVEVVGAEPICTFSSPSRFFSFRRDGVFSGRFGAFIALS